MGLDQYAYAVKPGPGANEFSLPEAAHEQEGQIERIAYWRKHADLQGWMQDLYLHKCEQAGVKPRVDEDGWFAGEVVFNCQPLLLTYEDLRALERDILEKNLPHTTGFFFGESTPEDDEDTLAFIEKAREALAADMLVYYDSWW